jgi:hypothetical protein
MLLICRAVRDPQEDVNGDAAMGFGLWCAKVR